MCIRDRVYAYDEAKKHVRWVPSSGVQDGVSGQAKFEAAPDGACKFTYAVDSQRGRAIEHPEAVANAFAAWVEKSVRSKVRGDSPL